MARVTVEDCVQRVPNRFDLVMLAAQRARNIGAGGTLTVDRDNDRNPVVALREIAEGTISLRELENNLVQSLQKVPELDEPEDDKMDLQKLEQELALEQGMPTAFEDIDEDDLHVEGEDGHVEGDNGEDIDADDDTGTDDTGTDDTGTDDTATADTLEDGEADKNGDGGSGDADDEV